MAFLYVDAKRFRLAIARPNHFSSVASAERISG
jgi:hypothetical protein